MPYNAAERKDVRDAEKAARIAERQRVEVVKGLLSTAPGRTYYLEKLEAAHVFSTSFATNALQMAFNEGERNQGLQLLSDIMRHCPEQYVLMMQERNERDVTAEQRRNASARRDRDLGESGDGAEGHDDDSGRFLNGEDNRDRRAEV